MFDFIQLLVKTNEPTLAEYGKFSGECGGESELEFELEECRLRGWDIYSEPCIAFTRRRCEGAEHVSSLELNWLRERFSTVGKNYRLIGIQSQSTSIDLIELKIGNNTFLLYYDASSQSPGGLIVGVSGVNGKKLSDYVTVK